MQLEPFGAVVRCGFATEIDPRAQSRQVGHTGRSADRLHRSLPARVEYVSSGN